MAGKGLVKSKVNDSSPNLAPANRFHKERGPLLEQPVLYYIPSPRIKDKATFTSTHSAVTERGFTSYLVI